MKIETIDDLIGALTLIRDLTPNKGDTKVRFREYAECRIDPIFCGIGKIDKNDDNLCKLDADYNGELCFLISQQA
jgi:hypothetical protein